MTREEMTPLLDAYRDGDIAEVDAGRLAEVIRERGEESKQALAELETEGCIAQALDDTDSESFLRSFWERHRAEKDSAHFVEDFEDKRVKATTSFRRRWWMAAAATVSVVLLAAGSFLWMPAPMAHLEQVRGDVVIVRGGFDEAFTSGQALHAGDGLRVTGEESSATVVFADGTRLEFGEDTVVTSVTDDPAIGKRIVLAEGFFTAQVAKQPAGRPMILATPQSEVVVLGTTFSLSVGTAVTHLETQSGNVCFKRTSDGRSVEVPAGFDAIVAAPDLPLVAQPLSSRSSTPRLQLEGCWTGALSRDSNLLAATRYIKGDVEFWNLTTGRQQSTFRAHDKRTTTAVFVIDGSLVTGSLDGTVKSWVHATNQLLSTLAPSLGEITAVMPSRDGRALTLLANADNSETRTLSSWERGSQKPLWGPKSFVADRLAFSPDGTMLATARKQDRFITLWNLDSGEVRTVLRASGDRSSGLLRNVFSLAFSHDGRTLAVDDMSGLVSFWDISTGQVRTKFQRHGGRIFGMGFSPDDRLLATGQQDDTIRIWDIASAAPVAALAGQSSTQTRDITFTSDGRALLVRGIRLAVGDRPRDGVLQLWDMPASLSSTKPR